MLGKKSVKKTRNWNIVLIKRVQEEIFEQKQRTLFDINSHTIGLDMHSSQSTGNDSWQGCR